MRYFSLVIFVFSVAHADTYKVAGSNSVTFEAVGHPSALKIHGTSNQLSGSFTDGKSGLSGELKIPLDSLDTGLSKRNEHMKTKYLEISKFPDAVVILDPIAGATGGAFKGTLSLHGVKKEINGTSLIDLKKSLLKGEADFTIKSSDFAIATPSFAGITMADDVKVHVVFEAKNEAELK